MYFVRNQRLPDDDRSLHHGAFRSGIGLSDSEDSDADISNHIAR